jgi:hypothetical protein
MPTVYVIKNSPAMLGRWYRLHSGDSAPDVEGSDRKCAKST